MNILSRTFEQLSKFETLMQKDLKDGLITVNYLINETECKILDYNKIQQYLTQNKVHNNTLLKEILIKCNSIINLWNVEFLPLKDRYSKEHFVYSNEVKGKYRSTPLDFYTLIAYKDKLRAVNGKTFFIENYDYSTYQVANIAQKCALIVNWVTTFVPDILLSNLTKNKILKNNDEVKENKYPEVFKNYIGYSIFLDMHLVYKDKDYQQANYSFLFYALKKDYLVCTGSYFIDFLSKLNIHISKIDNRQSGTNKKTDLFNSIQNKHQKKHKKRTI